ncbi:hypothetical protein [Flagellimonas meishanensis]|uniref:hypothetical protein n=1 Tax=Flagellimonas meishanensis TaxID=2873264 RepID=UPI001CA644C2|nr:hypothetical protein [[Muricauda] meishanensis]
MINSSTNSFTHVSMFSMPFKDLQPGDSSEFRLLRYDSLRHDPLIYCVSGGVNYGRYLKIPEEGVDKYTYVIDSIGNGLLHISSREGL